MYALETKPDHLFRVRLRSNTALMHKMHYVMYMRLITAARVQLWCLLSSRTPLTSLLCVVLYIYQLLRCIQMELSLKYFIVML